jgi:hypothetical protein
LTNIKNQKKKKKKKKKKISTFFKVNSKLHSKIIAYYI